MSSSKRPAEEVLEEPPQKSRKIYYTDSELINSLVMIVMCKKTPQGLQELTEKLVGLKDTVFVAVEGILDRCDDMDEEEDEEGESRKDKFLKRLFAAFDHRDAVKKWMHEGCDLSMKKLLNEQKVVVGFFACRHLFPALLREIESKIDGFRGKEEDAEELSELLNEVEGYSGDPLATFLEDDLPLFRDEDFLRQMADAFSFEP